MLDYKFLLKNGDTVVLKSDMPIDEAQSLPTFSNQHKLFSYFKEKGYQIQINKIIKKSLNKLS
jgi:hypothetical protein